ncbi:hypothetical protein D3C80_1448510 [compost metagenome]
MQTVVADSLCGVECLFEIAGFQHALLLHAMTPYARKAVSLQLHFHGKTVGFDLRCILLKLTNFRFDTEQFLNVVADFMRDNVALGEITVRAELAFHVIIEREIDVHGAVCRAIEWPHDRLSRAAASAGRAAIHHQLGLLIGAPHFFELLTPGVFCRRQNDRGEFCGFIFVRADGARSSLLLLNGISGD